MNNYGTKFNPHKSLIFCNYNSNVKPAINGVQVKITRDSFPYLNILFDRTGSTRLHPPHALTKISEQSARLNRLPFTLKQVVKGFNTVVIPAAMYGYPIAYWNDKQVKALQMVAKKGVIKSLNSNSFPTQALTLDTKKGGLGMCAIQDKMDKLLLSFMYKVMNTLEDPIASKIVLHLTGNGDWENMPGTAIHAFQNLCQKRNIVVHKSKILATRWKVPAILSAPCVSGDVVTVYTDGSKHKHSMPGIGIYFPEEDVRLSYRAVAYNDNTSAEIEAIAVALLSIQEATHICVYTDSSAAIEVVRKYTSDPKPTDRFILNATIELVKVQAHKGIHGNEIADALAKNGCKEPIISPLLITQTNPVTFLTDNSIASFAPSRFETASRLSSFGKTWSGTFFQIRKGNITDSALNNDVYRFLIMMRFRNLPTPAKLALFANKPNETKFCKCDGTSVADDKHIFLECPYTTKERQTLTRKLK